MAPVCSSKLASRLIIVNIFYPVRKETHKLILALMLVSVVCFCCRTGSKNSLVLAGSTSVQPFVELLAEIYQHHHPGVEINVQGGGSTAGIRAVKEHICDIGMCSRHLNPDESCWLTAIPIAIDGIVLVVHPANPVANVTVEQARGIFAGRIRNWQEVGGNDQRITVIIREEGSGTRASFEEKVMGGENFAPDALVQDSNGAVREIVAHNPGAIGYISFGLADRRVKVLAIDGVQPDEESIRTHRYPLARDFLLLIDDTQVSRLARSFIEFVLSDEGQEALAEEGLIRVR
jgi:phosphate transport system substrate-binding protein